MPVPKEFRSTMIVFLHFVFGTELIDILGPSPLAANGFFEPVIKCQDQIRFQLVSIGDSIKVISVTQKVDIFKSDSYESFISFASGNTTK